MAKLAARLNLGNIDPTQSTGNLPVGRHKVVITDTDIVASKNDANSGMAVLTLSCVEGAAQGQGMDYRLNIYHATSEQARTIALKQLSAVGHVVGVLDIEDLDQLKDKPFYVDVRMQKNSDQYTEIGKVYDVNGNEPGKQGPAPQSAQAAPQTAPAVQAGPSSGWQPAPAQPPAHAPQPASAWTPPATGGAPATPPWGQSK